jgi:hypothetical protein
VWRSIEGSSDDVRQDAIHVHASLLSVEQEFVTLDAIQVELHGIADPHP